jgi:hypothetical protein
MARRESMDARRARHRRYYAEHREEILAALHAKYWADPDAARARAYDKLYPERARRRKRKWRSANRERVNAWARAYRRRRNSALAPLDA